MFIVGLTGGIATGKSTVLAIFKEHGIPVIDADDVARRVVLPGTPGWIEIKKYFGETVFNSDNTLDRKALGEIVFNDLSKRQKLNSITHPKIHKEILRLTLQRFFLGHAFIVMELPLLFETRKMINFLHTIITVDCPKDIQLERLKLRDDFSEKVALKRIKTQMPIEQKIDKSHFAIDNSGDLEYTRKQTENIIKILQKSKFTWYFRLALLLVVVGVFIGGLNLITYLVN